MNSSLKSACIASVLVATSAAFAMDAPDSVLGRYASAPRSVCVPHGRNGKPTCSRSSDTLVIERTLIGGNRDVKVNATFTLADAQVCTFDGMGYWDTRNRSLVAADPRSGCELVLRKEGRGLRAVALRPDQCDSPCAGRNWLEGEVFRLRR